MEQTEIREELIKRHLLNIVTKIDNTESLNFLETLIDNEIDKLLTQYCNINGFELHVGRWGDENEFQADDDHPYCYYIYDGIKRHKIPEHKIILTNQLFYKYNFHELMEQCLEGHINYGSLFNAIATKIVSQLNENIEKLGERCFDRKRKIKIFYGNSVIINNEQSGYYEFGSKIGLVAIAKM